MKLEAQFKSADNRLYFLDGRELAVDSSVKDVNHEKGGLVFIDMPWEKVGLEEDSYNEEFLASMRDMLKKMEGESSYAVIVPVAEKIPETDAQKEAFIASMKHSARRIKDAKSVVGYAIPDYIDSNAFIDAFKAKHGHYIYFSSNDDVLKDSSIVRY
ncbi:MAG: hypothetical protein II547_05425 [Treponema sp.]|nr:hypothetical protein [Treponema sp.]